MTYDNRPLGIFDSGVGGLTVLKHIQKNLPAESVVYFGDTARVPYGEKTSEEINNFASHIVDFLLSQNVKAIVIACNTTSALAYENLKKKHKLPILDVITPAVKELPNITKNNKIGVIANLATVKSDAYLNQIKRNYSHISVYQQACPLLVPLIEEGSLETDYTREVLQEYLDPLLQKNIDTLILGCTHYPHLDKLLKEILGNQITILDPAIFIVDQLKDLLFKENLLRENTQPVYKYFVSGHLEQFKKIGSILFGQPIESAEKITW